MTIATLPEGDAIVLLGSAVKELDTGAPTSLVDFSVEVEEGNFVVTLPAVPAEITHWELLIRLLADVGPRAFLSPRRTATTSPTIADTIIGMTDGILARPEYAVASIRVELIPYDEQGRAGRSVPGKLLQLVLAPLVLITDPVIGGSIVGTVSIDVPPVFNLDTDLVLLSRVLQFSSDGEAWADVDLEANPSYDTIVPLAHLDGYRRHVWAAVGPLGDVIEDISSNEIGPITEVSVGTPSQILPEDVTFEDSYFVGTVPDATTWIKARVSLADYPDNTDPDVDLRVTFSVPEIFPSDPITAWENLAPMPGSSTDWTPLMEDVGKNTPGSIPRVDFTSWEGDDAAMERFRIAVRVRTDGIWSNWSPVSPSMTIPQPTIVPPSGDTTLWRQDLYRDASALGLPPDVPELFPHGLYGMDGWQFMPCGAISSDGLFFVMGQDSSSLRVSFGGLRWYYPDNIGLPIFSIIGACIDPVVTAGEYTVYIIAYANFQTNKDGLAGVYKSTDSCKTWTRIQQLDGDIGGTQWVSQNLKVFPRTGSAASRRVFAIAGREGTTKGTLYWRSDVGGTDGTQVSMNSSFGLPYFLEVVSASIVYVGTMTGLFRTTTGGLTTGAWAKVANFPAGCACRSLWVDPDDTDHQIATANVAGGGGVYETTDAWATAPTRILNERIHAIGVLAPNGSGQRIIVALLSAGNILSRVAFIRKANGTWVSGASAGADKVTLFRPGVDTTVQPFSKIAFTTENNTGNAQSHGFILPHPTEPRTAWAFGDTGFWRTVDGGITWSLSMAGWGGLNRRSGVFAGQPNGNWMHSMAGCHDTGGWRSKDAGRSATIHKILAALKNMIDVVAGRNITSYSFSACTMLPNDASVSYAPARGRFIGGYGHTGKKALLYMDWGSNSFQHLLGSNPTVGQSNGNGGGTVQRTWSGYLPHDPDKCWCGPNVSINGSQTWKTAPSGRQVWAGYGDETDRCFMMQSGEIWLGDPFDGNAAAPVRWFTPVPSNMWIEVADAFGAVCPQFNYVIIRGANSLTLRLIRPNGAVGQETSFSVTALDGDDIRSIAWDQLDPRYIYISFGNLSMGTPECVFRGKFNANFSTITWENITTNLVKSAHTVELNPHTWTGDFFAYVSGSGTYVIAAPDDWKPVMGVIKLSSNPSNNDTIVVNSITITFKSSAPGANEVLIGADDEETAENLAAMLNASADVSITPCTYTAYDNRVHVTMDAPPEGVLTAFPITVSGTGGAHLLHPAKVNYRGYWGRCPYPIYEG